MNVLLALFYVSSVLIVPNPGKRTSPHHHLKTADKEMIGAPKAVKHFKGKFSNGIKGVKFSFDVSADGKRLENLTYQGYWYCGGKLDLTTAGPEGYFTITNNKVNQHISEPPNGGSTAWRFDLTADIKGKKASGTFRMNISNLGCNTGMLNWTAEAQ